MKTEKSVKQILRITFFLLTICFSASCGSDTTKSQTGNAVPDLTSSTLEEDVSYLSDLVCRKKEVEAKIAAATKEKEAGDLEVQMETLDKEGASFKEQLDKKYAQNYDEFEAAMYKAVQSKCP